MVVDGKEGFKIMQEAREELRERSFPETISGIGGQKLVEV